MNNARVTRSLWRQAAMHTRPAVRVSRRNLATETQPPLPPPPRKEPSRVGAYYGTFGSPLLKCFLGALFTYQLAYYLWYKLETVEERHETRLEIAELQQELKQALEKQSQAAQEKWDRAAEVLQREKHELGEAVDAVVEEVREGADEVGRGTRAVGKVAGGGWWPW
ncbi:hypothetical protein COCVIDRAFT_38608 [Bipolaris victoriae FI3]|uniref:Uncharacterized protein n=2 Tax=Bipolaris TaxID=33194 RepID=W6Y714_COCC2|nr:uncharacterized protein COCCADRAFT_36973 [Bipolaris zeicola 26-R-13]XP_014555736.1 hypothetical protein COCVIDRAFT_38608 [Bipolaris victoriae FI3]EUC33215.1 hypothetical protein COCCADRAFT_36973 [Bipolaris zeicola 26-R-13]